MCGDGGGGGVPQALGQWQLLANASIPSRIRSRYCSTLIGVVINWLLPGGLSNDPVTTCGAKVTISWRPARASAIATRPNSGLPKPQISFTASVAMVLAACPTTGPSTPTFSDDGVVPGAGCTGYRSRNRTPGPPSSGVVQKTETCQFIATAVPQTSGLSLAAHQSPNRYFASNESQQSSTRS